MKSTSLLPTLVAIAAVGLVGLWLVAVIRRLTQKMNPTPPDPATQKLPGAPSAGSSKAQYLNLVVSEKGLAEYEGNRRVVFVPKRDVQSIEIRFGPQAERPLLQGIAGLVLMALGIAGFSIVQIGGFAKMRWGLGELVFGGLGIWLMWEASKRGHYLQVSCARETWKLALKGSVCEVELSQFTQRAAHFGYVIRDCREPRTPDAVNHE